MMPRMDSTAATGPRSEADDENPDEAEEAAVADARADPRSVPHAAEMRAWLLRVAAGDFGAPPPLAVGRRDAATFAAASAALPALCRRFRVRRLDVFGSAATGDGFDPARSDLDLLVAFEDGLSAGEYADAFFGLRAALEERFERPVDLLTEAALKNPYLRRQVEEERRPLFPVAAAA